MNRFAGLPDRLAYEPGRNNKLRLLTSYFREVEDPDRGYALGAVAGALSFKHANPGLIRDLIAARTDPVLFALSYDYVGDLSETVALMWPKAGINREETLLGHPSPQPSPLAGEGQGEGYRELDAHDDQRPQNLHNNPPPPTLTEGLTTLPTLGKTELPKQLTHCLAALDQTSPSARQKLL